MLFRIGVVFIACSSQHILELHVWLSVSFPKFDTKGNAKGFKLKRFMIGTDSDIVTLQFTESYREGTNNFANGFSWVGVDLGWNGRILGFSNLVCVLCELSSKCGVFVMGFKTDAVNETMLG